MLNLKNKKTIMKTLTSLSLLLTLTFLTSSLFSQDISYVSGTDTFKTLTSDYVLTGDSTVVIDTVFSDNSLVTYNDGSVENPIEFTINGGYETYTLFYEVSNETRFNGDFYLKINGQTDTTINFGSQGTSEGKTEVVEGDLVNMTIDDIGFAEARVISNVVNTSIYVGVEKAVSVNDNDFNMSYSMFPNPVVNQLNFSFDNYPSQVLFQVFDMSGRLLNDGQMFNNTINVTELPRGSYVLRLSVDGNTFSDRFIKR